MPNRRGTLRLALLGLAALSVLTLLALRAALGLSIPETGVAAQPQRPPAPVRYTEARAHTLRRSIQLPGTVEPRITSLVAAQTAGVVEEFTAREGRRVSKGRPLAQLRRTTVELQLESVTGQLREASARLALAESGLERSKELLESELISRQQHDDDLSEFNAWRGRMDQFEAEKATLEDDLERATIRAPFAGIVVEEHTEVGQWLGAGDTVVELMSLGDLEVVVDAPERYFSILKRGTAARVAFQSLSGVQVEGEVSAVIPRADSQARTFPLKVRIPNRDGQIGVGMLADVAFLAGESYETVIVPKDAVVQQGPQKLVFVLNDDNTVAPTPVQPGEEAGAWTGISGPIQPGQRVVTRGNERLQPGQTVQGEPLEYELP